MERPNQLAAQRRSVTKIAIFRRFRALRFSDFGGAERRAASAGARARCARAFFLFLRFAIFKSRTRERAAIILSTPRLVLPKTES